MGSHAKKRKKKKFLVVVRNGATSAVHIVSCNGFRHHIIITPPRMARRCKVYCIGATCAATAVTATDADRVDVDRASVFLCVGDGHHKRRGSGLGSAPTERAKQCRTRHWDFLRTVDGRLCYCNIAHSLDFSFQHKLHTLNKIQVY